MRKPKEDTLTIGLLIIIIFLVVSFLYSSVKQKTAPTFIYVRKPETISVKPQPDTPITPIITAPVVVSPPPTPWKIYSNKEYGFAFIYPSTWTLRENSSNKQVTVTSDTAPGSEFAPGLDDTPPLEVIGFQDADKSFFTPYVETKYGEITYDETQKTLVDESHTPPRCLPVSTLSGVVGAMKSIIYGGSLVADPAHSESAVLTKKGDIIIASESWEVGSDANQNTQIKDEVAKIMTSFTLLNGNTVSIPNCTTGN
jgi:hypothetical protein